MTTLRFRSFGEHLSTTLLASMLCLAFALAGAAPTFADETAGASGDASVEEAADEKPEMLPNPMYERWSRFEVGSSVTMTMRTELPGSTMENISRITLKSMNEKEVVLETTMISIVNGEEVEGTPQVQRHVAMLPRSPLTDSSMQNVTDEGTETLSIEGREIATAWKTIRNENEGGVSTMTSWESDEIPGGLAKHHTVSEGVANVTSTLIVTSYEVK